MARRIPLNDPATIIRYIEEYDGVILTGFRPVLTSKKSTLIPLPNINAILEDICRQRLCLLSPKFTNYPNSDTSLSNWSLLQETNRATRLFARSTTARKSLFQQPTSHKVFNYFLRTETIAYHDPDPLKLSTDHSLVGGNFGHWYWCQGTRLASGRFHLAADSYGPTRKVQEEVLMWAWDFLFLVSKLVSSGHGLGCFCHLPSQLLRWLEW